MKSVEVASRLKWHFSIRIFRKLFLPKLKRSRSFLWRAGCSRSDQHPPSFPPLPPTVPPSVQQPPPPAPPTSPSDSAFIWAAVPSTTGKKSWSVGLGATSQGFMANVHRATTLLLRHFRVPNFFFFWSFLRGNQSSIVQALKSFTQYK